MPAGSLELIIVDNASTDGSVPWLQGEAAAGRLRLIANKRNVGFPAACNQGINAASPDADIYLLNQDTVLMDNAVFWLRMGLYEQDSVGSAGSVSNYPSPVTGQQACPNGQDLHAYELYAKTCNVPMRQPYEDKWYLVGFSLLLKRTVLNKVGLLDERFGLGCYEDNDLCLRILNAGYRNVICRNSFIVHWGSRSFRSVDRPSANGHLERVEANHRLFIDKWRDLLPARYWLRQSVCLNLIDMIGTDRLKPGTRVLEIGCGMGMSLSHISSLADGIETYGIEPDPKAAGIAAHFTSIIGDDFNTWDAERFEGSMDIVIMDRTLASLPDTKAALRKARKLLKPGAVLALCVPNLMHYSVMVPLVTQGEFTYIGGLEARTLDKSTLKLFTRTEILRNLKEAGLNCVKIAPARDKDPDADTLRVIEALSSISGGALRGEFLNLEYYAIAERGE